MTATCTNPECAEHGIAKTGDVPPAYWPVACGGCGQPCDTVAGDPGDR